ncbi:hypothetical protein BDZ89DRAFT_1200472 [Hymenopellis radicata]|nr:hypothetical protein BDZ89DRAFT_1200472 [Hymenopellis radicata]
MSRTPKPIALLAIFPNAASTPTNPITDSLRKHVVESGQSLTRACAKVSDLPDSVTDELALFTSSVLPRAQALMATFEDDNAPLTARCQKFEATVNKIINRNPSLTNLKKVEATAPMLDFGLALRSFLACAAATLGINPQDSRMHIANLCQPFIKSVNRTLNLHIPGFAVDHPLYRAPPKESKARAHIAQNGNFRPRLAAGRPNWVIPVAVPENEAVPCRFAAYRVTCREPMVETAAKKAPKTPEFIIETSDEENDQPDEDTRRPVLSQPLFRWSDDVEAMEDGEPSKPSGANVDDMERVIVGSRSANQTSVPGRTSSLVPVTSLWRGSELPPLKRRSAHQEESAKDSKAIKVDSITIDATSLGYFTQAAPLIEGYRNQVNRLSRIFEYLAKDSTQLSDLSRVVSKPSRSPFMPGEHPWAIARGHSAVHEAGTEVEVVVEVVQWRWEVVVLV